MNNSITTSTAIDLSEEWEIIRQDDPGNTFRFRRHLSREVAEKQATERNNSGHHQKYYARPYQAHDPSILE